jgi:formylglycine-generating enzyme required for sulfatase activity
MTGTECQGGDCCESPLVPGGTFTQGSGTSTSFPATVSDFRLDRYEVTVARFRAFVAAYDGWRNAGNPTAGAGVHPDIDGSGWDASFTSELPADSAALKTSLACKSVLESSTFYTFADSGDDTLPINCVDWFTAEAFCIWDRGRLPTESEWEYAASGGTHEYTYPWGDTPLPTNAQDTAQYADYGCLSDGSASGDCVFLDITSVGSKPLGRGAFGQDDLAGSMWEWVLDGGGVYPTTAAMHYFEPPSVLSGRTVRGGCFNSYSSNLATTYRRSDSANLQYFEYGLRCARNP